MVVVVVVVLLLVPIVPHVRPADGDQVPERREVTSGAGSAGRRQASGTRSTAGFVDGRGGVRFQRVPGVRSEIGVEW